MSNLLSTQGLIVGEAVMMGLAPHFGRNASHDIVYGACKDCIENRSSTLLDELKKRKEVTDVITEAELAKLCDPVNYLGSCQLMVDDVLEAFRATQKAAKNGTNGFTNGTH